MIDELPNPPYPADVRARGWTFQLDVERIENSDTWLLTPDELKPVAAHDFDDVLDPDALRLPAGDDALIAARIRLVPEVFSKVRDILLRGCGIRLEADHRALLEWKHG